MACLDRGRFLLALAAGLGITTAAPGDEADIGRGVGTRVPDFTLTQSSGEPVSLDGSRGKAATVLFFSGTDCPVGNLYLPRLAALNERFKDRGVVFLAINSNASEPASRVAEHAESFGLSFPVLKDDHHRVADLLDVRRTCEVLVLDGRARLRYRGAIDDQYAPGLSKAEPTRHHLADALEAILDGGEVETTATSVFGCLIERDDARTALAASSRPRVRPAPPEIVEAYEAIEADAAVEVGEVSYAADVATILQKRCQSCHRPGQVAPFSLMSYDDARRWAGMIYEVVDQRRMPPWHADPRHGRFANDRSLSPRERATLLAWVEQDTPAGDLTAAPPPREFAEGWTIGTPDLIFQIPQEFAVRADGALGYKYFRVPTGFTEDVWVQAAEARPTDRSVVHHILVYVDDHSGRRRGQGDSHFCGYAPGEMPSAFPPGVAKKIPAGSDLIFELHYTPNGKARFDRSAVGLVLAREPVTHRAITRGIANPGIRIPPEGDDHPEFSTFTFRDDARLLSLMPHMHLRGKSFRYTADFPDGRSEVLLSVPAYDFGWQSYYTLAEPRAMPKGTVIRCEARYDNSEQNPANPDPTRFVRWGEQTWEEMMIGYIDYIPDQPLDPATDHRDAAEDEQDAAGSR